MVKGIDVLSTSICSVRASFDGSVLLVAIEVERLGAAFMDRSGWWVVFDWICNKNRWIEIELLLPR